MSCILGQVWYLIVSIPDLCTITYFFTVFLKNRNINSKIKRSKVTDYAALRRLKCFCQGCGVGEKHKLSVWHD